jgi:glycosyltransferase involved in cell wall biosynthesis
MKICLVSVVTYGHGIKGGMEIHGRVLTRELAARGHDVTVISSRHPSGQESERLDGITFHYLRDTTFASQKGAWASACDRRFRELHREQPFDILCCQHMVVPTTLIDFARQRGIPVVVIIEGLAGWMLLSEIRQAMSHRKGYGQLGRRLGAFLYYYLSWELPVARRCNALIAVSNEVAQSVPRWCGVSPRKVHTVYNGVDVRTFAPNPDARETVRRQYHVATEDRLIVFLSHVTRQKGLHVLIKSMPEILAARKGVKLLVAGEGDDLEGAKHLMDSLGLERHIIFAGHVPHEYSPRYLNAADLFVLPTLRQEGMPFALLEAMACQKPVIASRIGGVPSVVEHDLSGLLVPPGKATDLTRAILRLFDDEKLAERLARTARETVARSYSIDSMVDGTLRVFDAALREIRPTLPWRRKADAST